MKCASCLHCFGQWYNMRDEKQEVEERVGQTLVL